MANPKAEVPVAKINQQEVFVGPRPFERSEQNLFFGRDREISELLSLVTSNRVVLCYAPSGAGKTSLINAGLQPRLEQEGFEVLPSTRVRGLIPEGVDQTSIANIYIFNTILSLAKETGVPAELARCTLAEYLSTVPHLTDAEDFSSPRILIFDQFEELLTSYLERWQERDSFFQQVRDALQEDPLLRVLFVMREDYIARIEPFIRILKPLQQTRFRLDLLGPHGAQAAVTGPLRGTHRYFKDGVVDTLIEELLKVRVESTQGEATEIVGEYVEPVQLQVVCRNLWNSLPPDVQEISEEHVKAYGDVDQALRDFYESCLIGAKTSLRANESDLRQWFERQLITPAGTRSIVFRDARQTAGLANAVVDFLENRHIIRGEWRAGSRWYELTHDRLIEPIQRANERWRAERQALRNRWVTAAGGILFLVLLLLAATLTIQRPASQSPGVVSTAVAATVGVESSNVQATAQVQAQVAQEDAALSKSRQLAAEALLTDNRNLSLLLAIQANRSDDTVEARRSLHKVLSRQAYADGKFLRELRSGLTTPTLVQRLDNHQGSVASVAFGPDGKQFVSVSGDGTLILWDVATAKQSGPSLTEPRSSIASVAFSPDGLLIASAGQDEQISLWDVSDGKPHGVPLRGHDGLVTCVAFSPDGKYIASGGIDGRVRIWEVATGKLLAKLTNADAVWALAWSPDGKYLASGGFDSAVHLWDAKTLDKIRSLNRDNGGIRSLAWSPDSQLLASASAYQEGEPEQGEVIVWNVVTGEIMARPLPERIQPARTVAFDPTGRTLAIGRDDGTITLWDVQSKQIVIDLLKAHNHRIMSIAFSPDGRYMVSGSVDETIALWDLSAPTSNLVVSPTGDLLATGQGSIISLWDLSKGLSDPVKILSGHTKDVLALAFSSDGKILASSGEDKTIRFWNVDTGQQAGQLNTLSNVNTLQFSLDGKRLAQGGDSGRAQLSNPQTGDILCGLIRQEGPPVLKVQYSTDGNTLDVVAKNGGLTTFDLQSREPCTAPESLLPSAQDGITSIALSLDGKRAAYFRVGGTGETAVLSNDGRAHGIELSSWDQSFDPTVNPSDIDFVLVKATDGAKNTDPNFDKYVKQIQSIPMRGAYHYFRDNQPWREQADLFLSAVKGKRFHFYVLYLESPPKGESTQFLADAEQWLQYVDEQVNGRVLLGISTAFLSEFESAGPWMKEWPLLVAQYPSHPDRNADPLLPRGFTEWRIWNYTDKGDNAEFGTARAGVNLYVYNGTPQDMGEWLGLNAFSILDRDTGAVIHPNQAVEINGTNSFAFSPDSTYLAAAGDGSVFLLNAVTGEEISTLNIGGRTVYSLNFMPDSDHLAIGTDDGTVLLWDLSLLRSAAEIDSMIGIACSQVNQNFTQAEWAQYSPDAAYDVTCSGVPVP